MEEETNEDQIKTAGVEDWEKEFLQEFGIHFSESELQFAIEFITEKIQRAKEEERERIMDILEGMKREPVRVDEDYDGPDTSETLTFGFNEALQKAISKIRGGESGMWDNVLGSCIRNY